MEKIKRKHRKLVSLALLALMANGIHSPIHRETQKNLHRPAVLENKKIQELDVRYEWSVYLLESLNLETVTADDINRLEALISAVGHHPRLAAARAKLEMARQMLEDIEPDSAAVSPLLWSWKMTLEPGMV